MLPVAHLVSSGPFFAEFACSSNASVGFLPMPKEMLVRVICDWNCPWVWMCDCWNVHEISLPILFYLRSLGNKWWNINLTLYFCFQRKKDDHYYYYLETLNVWPGPSFSVNVDPKESTFPLCLIGLPPGTPACSKTPKTCFHDSKLPVETGHMLCVICPGCPFSFAQCKPG